MSWVLAWTCLWLSGCGPGARRADLVIVNGAEPESLDPAVLTGQADGRIALALFEGLMRNNPTNGEPMAGLAERWEVSPDGREFRFHLRTNAAWSTGEPIGAEDVVYSWRRVLDPRTASEYAGLLFYLRNGAAYNAGRVRDPEEVGVHAEGERVVRVELEGPTSFFLNLCTCPTLVVVPRHWIERHGDRWLARSPVPSSGAYELVGWRVNDRVRLRRNERYWDAANTRCATVDLLSCNNATTALNLYETREVDVVWDKNLVPAELLDVLLHRPDFQRYDSLGTYFIRFNVTREPFDDVRVRRALGMVIDKRRIVERITRAGERVASGYTPPGTGGYEPPEGLPFDVSGARRLLAEAGYPGGRGFPRCTYLFDTTSRLQEQIAVELQEMWRRELGVEVELRKLEWKTFLRAQGQLDYDLCRGSWIGDYNDPNTFLDMFMSQNGNNRTGWKSEAYDTLITRANGELDRSRRYALLREAEALLVREGVPVVPLFVYAGLEYFDPERIGGIFPNLLGEHPLRVVHRRDR